MTEKEFCAKCDKHLTDVYLNHLDIYHSGTYLSPWNKNEYAIRFPGATRGMLTIDGNGIIQHLDFLQKTSFSQNIGCYKKSILNLTKELIGETLEVILT